MAPGMRPPGMIPPQQGGMMYPHNVIEKGPDIKRLAEGMKIKTKKGLQQFVFIWRKL